MDRDVLQEFARRDWSAVETSKATLVPFINPEDLIDTAALRPH